MTTTAAARPQVTVWTSAGTGEKGDREQVPLPAVLLAPIRPDVVQFVHTNVRKNKRQAYAVNKDAGHQTSAESWGTGRAVARIPRVHGGGTHRSGQGAFGNMCRGGRMFAPTKAWRRWHRRVNKQQRRYAVCSALAASAVPALVMARGHRVERVPELPLVVSNDAVDALTKARDASALLATLGAADDVQRVRDSRSLRAGRGKMRNRRHVQGKGPLVVYAAKSPLVTAFRNIPGVELCAVDRLNLLQLAPGGHLGRFVIWTKDAFARLDALYGAPDAKAAAKANFHVPRSVMFNADLQRLLHSDEIRAALRPAQSRKPAFRPQKRNPLTNVGAMIKLNPAFASRRRAMLLQEAAGKKARAQTVAEKRTAAKAAAKSKKSAPKFTAMLLAP